MKKIRIVLIVLMITMLTGCDNKEKIGNAMISSTEITTTHEVTVASEEELSETNITTELITEEIKSVELVSVEEFMKYYSLTEDQVPMEYLEEYIKVNKVTFNDVEKWNLGQSVINDYKHGIPYGYDVQQIFDGPESQEPLNEYIEEVEVIQIRFDRQYGEFFNREFMVIDLKEMKIYYSKTDVDDYTLYDQSADLSAEAVEEIREELPTHIDDSVGYVKPEVFGEYSFDIFMNASDDTTKFYYGDMGEPQYFPGFDEYWKGLYKEHFGKEYEFQSFYVY